MEFEEKNDEDDRINEKMEKKMNEEKIEFLKNYKEKNPLYKYLHYHHDFNGIGFMIVVNKFILLKKKKEKN
jgi:hypothetical protein